jgi:multiple sugar transport system permease protein
MGQQLQYSKASTPRAVARLGAAIASVRGRRISGQTLGYLFIAPAVVFLLLVLVYPLLTTLRLSFEEVVVRTRTTSFVGLQNYARLIEDRIFWESLKNTLYYTIGSTVLHLLVGGFFALLLNEKWAASPIRNLFRGLLILPWLFSMAASALMWALLYSPLGALNHILLSTGLVSTPVDFLGDRNVVMWSLITINVWKSFPFYMVMILGGLQSIPLDLYDAAHVDGANRLQRFRHVTLPMLRPVLVAITAIDFITTFSVFDIVKLMTNGGPIRATTTTAFYVWQTGFRDVNFGYGSAISVVMLIVLGLGTLVYLRIVSTRQTTYGDTTTAL